MDKPQAGRSAGDGRGRAMSKNAKIAAGASAAVVMEGTPLLANHCGNDAIGASPRLHSEASSERG